MRLSIMACGGRGSAWHWDRKSRYGCTKRRGEDASHAEGIGPPDGIHRTAQCLIGLSGGTEMMQHRSLGTRTRLSPPSPNPPTTTPYGRKAVVVAASRRRPISPLPPSLSFSSSSPRHQSAIITQNGQDSSNRCLAVLQNRCSLLAKQPLKNKRQITCASLLTALSSSVIKARNDWSQGPPLQQTTSDC